MINPMISTRTRMCDERLLSGCWHRCRWDVAEGRVEQDGAAAAAAARGEAEADETVAEEGVPPDDLMSVADVSMRSTGYSFF